MLNIFFHLMLAVGLIWLQARQKYRLKPWQLSLIWFSVGAALASIGTATLDWEAYGPALAQVLVIELFYLPPAFFAFRWADKWRKGLLVPLLIFLAFAAISTVAAGLYLARAEIVSGRLGLIYSEIRG